MEPVDFYHRIANALKSDSVTAAELGILLTETKQALVDADKNFAAERARIESA
jgi:hypothetical protein